MCLSFTRCRMPHLQAYAALWLIIQMALGRERCKVHQDWATCLQKKQVTSGHSPRPNKDFVICLSHGKTGEVFFFLTLTLSFLEENGRVSAQTIPSGAVNKLLCLEIDRLHYRMNQSLAVFTTWLMSGHLWCTDTFAADVTGSHWYLLCWCTSNKGGLVEFGCHVCLFQFGQRQLMVSAGFYFSVYFKVY